VGRARCARVRRDSRVRVPRREGWISDAHAVAQPHAERYGIADSLGFAEWIAGGHSIGRRDLINRASYSLRAS
jgi:hypothetical protein